MNQETACQFCNKPLMWVAYIKHIINDCTELLSQEKANANNAAKNLFCECYICHCYIRYDRYTTHSEKCFPPIESIVWNRSHPNQLMCYCPCHPHRVEMPYAEYKQHILERCHEYIRFIAAHCRPSAEWPLIEQGRLKYWVKMRLNLRTQKPSSYQQSQDESVEERSSSVWSLPGGLCNGNKLRRRGRRINIQRLHRS